jgi:hypothetical protein
MQHGILSSVTGHCHELEAPELRYDPLENLKIETHQVPAGQFSALSQLKAGLLSAADTLILCVLNFRSNWESGKTHRNSLRKLHELTGLSIRYIREIRDSLLDSGWLSYLTKGGLGSRFKITHHLCSRDEVPTDRRGHPYKFAAPKHAFQMMFDGRLSWKSCLLYLMLWRHSDWNTGITAPITIEDMRKWLSMSPQTISDCLRELKKAGLLKRTSPKNRAGEYQLYPKPDAKPKPFYRPPKAESSTGAAEMGIDGDWRISYNRKWRLNVLSGEIQYRAKANKGVWHRPSDYTLAQEMPKAIRRDFEETLLIAADLRESLLKAASGVTDNAQGVTDTASASTDDAHFLFDGAV